MNQPAALGYAAGSTDTGHVGGSGAFTFQAVKAGTYTLTTSAALYTTSTQTVNVAAGQTSNVTVRLRTLLGL